MAEALAIVAAVTVWAVFLMFAITEAACQITAALREIAEELRKRP